MARPRTAEPYIQQKISLPATLMARFARLKLDPVRGKMRYGAVSSVMTQLLTDYVNRMEAGGQDVASELAGETQPSKLEAL